MNQTRGSSLVELILYTGLLSTILVVLYQLFALAGYQKIGQVVQDEIYVNANHVVADLKRTVTAATSISTPALGNSTPSLSLNGGSISYQLDANNRLTKTEGGVTAFLTNDKVKFNSLSFSQFGPSLQSPTMTVLFELAGVHIVEGREKAEQFQTAVSVR